MILKRKVVSGAYWVASLVNKFKAFSNKLTKPFDKTNGFFVLYYFNYNAMMLKVLIRIFFCSILVLFIVQCSGSKKVIDISKEEEEVFNLNTRDTVIIENDSLEYEIIIMEIGFNTWLQSIAKPRGYYTQNYMENRNRIYVINWNQRVLEPLRFDPNLYELQINYDSNIDYGYEVNYKLYNYFIYFQRKYNQRLGPFAPRIN